MSNQETDKRETYHKSQITIEDLPVDVARQDEVKGSTSGGTGGRIYTITIKAPDAA